MLLTSLKAAAAAALLLSIGWLLWIQPRFTLPRRAGIFLLVIVLIVPTFALGVSVRCDLDQLPDAECSCVSNVVLAPWERTIRLFGVVSPLTNSRRGYSVKVARRVPPRAALVALALG